MKKCPTCGVLLAGNLVDRIVRGEETCPKFAEVKELKNVELRSIEVSTKLNVLGAYMMIGAEAARSYANGFSDSVNR